MAKELRAGFHRFIQRWAPLMTHNWLRYPMAWLGVTSAGMAVVPVNSRSGPLDARH